MTRKRSNIAGDDVPRAAALRPKKLCGVSGCGYTARADKPDQWASHYRREHGADPPNVKDLPRAPPPGQTTLFQIK